MLLDLSVTKLHFGTFLTRFIWLYNIFCHWWLVGL